MPNTITFRISGCPTSYGDKVFVCGNVSFLGGWQVDQARELEYELGQWTITVSFTGVVPLKMEYKYIIKSQQEVKWEATANRGAYIFQLTAEVRDVWQVVGSKAHGAEELYVLETIERIYNESKALPERKAFTPRQAQYILSPPYIERAKQARTRPLVNNLIRDIDCEVGSQTERAITAQGYRLDGHIKSGGIGQIRKGYHVQSCAPVAAKVLHVGDAQNEWNVSQLFTSPHILRYSAQFSFTHEDGSPMCALIMPLYSLSLQDVYDSLKGTPLEPHTLKRVAVSVLQALIAFHNANLAHSDIKPGNIMVTPSGEFVVIDLGGAVMFGHSVTMSSPFYNLNASKDAVTYQFDLNCLAVTIKEGEDPRMTSRGGAGIVASFDQRTFASHIARIIYRSTSASEALNLVLAVPEDLYGV